MTVSPIGNIFNAIGFAQPTAAANPAAETGAANGAAASGGDGNAFMNMLDGLQGTHDNADQLAVGAATGNITDIHNYSIAATEAQIMTELTVAVRDRAVASFEEIMRMQA